MSYVRFGSTGLQVSRLCLGCMSYGDRAWRPWMLDESRAREHFKKAFDLGINFFDTADMYSLGRSEEITGKLLKEIAPREEFVLATKVFFPASKKPNRGGLSRKHILAACDASLRRLGMDFIDVYYIHRWDFGTPIEETLEALDSLVRAGKVRYLGASSMAAWQFAKALFTADTNGWHRFVAMQDHFNLVYREEEREMIPLCLDQKIALVPWSPLARGFLTGARTRETPRPTDRSNADEFADRMYYKEEDFKVLDAVLDVARSRDVKPAQVALAWLLTVPGVVSPIVGATKIDHIADAAGALEIKLTPEEIARLEAPYVPHPIHGHDQPTPRQPSGSGRMV